MSVEKVWRGAALFFAVVGAIISVLLFRLRWIPRADFDILGVGWLFMNAAPLGVIVQIDHVELFVPNRYDAAAWYQRVLGLEILSDYQQWAADSGGPLMISSDEGNTKLALFEGGPHTASATAGFRRVAFRVDATTTTRRARHSLPARDERARFVTRATLVPGPNRLNNKQAFADHRRS